MTRKPPNQTGNTDPRDAEGLEPERISPSAFMRQLRPGCYSDSKDRTSYQLDAPLFESHLASITVHNQTNDFQIFCRKLCERAICPNLRPATGPEGGGDSKADTETIPVADEVAQLYYVGDANAARERWAFAFSAKKDWVPKVRSDVAGIVGKQRGYSRIICVTSQPAADKKRSELEDELTKKFDIPVTIHDRSWIVKEVIDGDRKDLAFNYLKVGKEVTGSRLGPEDYSRTQQLEDLEKSLADPTAYAGMETQRVTEALLAAKLSRNLERPRFETDGRFARAVRLADSEGTSRQRLEIHYEQLWTAFWYFDDFTAVNSGYDNYEAINEKSDHAIDVELLCNLAQLLVNMAIHRHLGASELQLDARIARLTARLQAMADDATRPNNALHARLELLRVQVNQAVLAQDPDKLVPIWPHVAEILEQARGMGEFPADKLTRLVEVFGRIAGDDRGYARLVDKTAEFVAERKSEAEGALVLLERAKQLDFAQRFEMIRLLGKAAYCLTKKEYASSMIEATSRLSLAYRSAGLLWAARASCLMTLAAIFIEAEEDSDVPASVIPTLMILAWITLELRHIPDALEAVRLARGCALSLPLTEDSKKHAQERLTEFDLAFASRIVNLSGSELAEWSGLPDVLEGLGMVHSSMALLYVLGYEDKMRSEGLDDAVTSDKLAEFYGRLAGKVRKGRTFGAVLLNQPAAQVYTTVVLGIRVDVSHSGSDVGAATAEAIVGAVEAFFATTVDVRVTPHAERFSIQVDEIELEQPSFDINAEHAQAQVKWPANKLPGDTEGLSAAHDLLLHLAGGVLAATCSVADAKETLNRLFEDDGVLFRISMILGATNSRSRILKKGVGRLSDWTSLVETNYPLRDDRPVITPVGASAADDDDEEAQPSTPKAGLLLGVEDHRDLVLRSIIDVHLWKRARWFGAVFVDGGEMLAVALLFHDGSAGREIFSRWRKRFGEVDSDNEIYLAIVRGISASHPFHYGMLVTSKPIPAVAAEPRDNQLFAGVSTTVQAQTDVNLARFIDGYARNPAYLLLPAHFGGDGRPVLGWDLAIKKSHVSIKNSADVLPSDPESMATRTPSP